MTATEIRPKPDGVRLAITQKRFLGVLLILVAAAGSRAEVTEVPRACRA